MFEGAVAGILNRLLGKYVQDLDTEHLNVGIFSGNVNLSDLKLKPEALYELDLPIDVKIGTIGRVTLQIPWSNLYTQPVVVHIEDVLVLVGPAISNSFFDPEREKRLSRAAKRNVLQDLEADSEILKGPQDFFQHLFTAIMNNIQIYVRNVHVRYEDSISSKDGPLACGLCLQSLSVETTNSKWKPSVTPPNATTVYQMMRIESLSLYWNPTATVLDDNETAHITPMQYYSWKHYMLTGLDKFSMHQEDFEFVLKPVSLKVKALQSRAGGLLLDAVLPDSALQLSRRQLLSARTLRLALRRLRGNRKYRHLHPGVPLSKDVRKWWRYAYNAVVEQRVRPYTWAAIKKHRENYNMYKQTYKSTLRSPNDIELKLDLQKCEDSLPIISVVIAREQAKFELLKQEPDRIKVVETEFDWWKSASSPEAEPETTRVELLVKSERHKSIWSHLSSPERRRVCELIGYVEGEPRSDKGKQCIEHKLNLTLANCSLTLMNRNKEVLVVSLTQFLVSLETRPSARAYKISARTESIVVEGVSSDELVPLLSAERGCGSSKAERGAGGAGQPERGCGSSHLLAVDFERNPAGGDADYGFSLLMEPIEVVYVEQAITELISFFQTHSMSASELSSLSCAAAARAAARSRALAAHAVSRRKMSHVNVHVKRLCAVLPEHGARHQFGQLMIVDLSRLLIKSDLQPPSLVLEDATCMELEERLYDRLHAECCAQVLLCDWDAPWRDAVKQADSELHLLPKMKAQIVFSNSIKKDYKLLPKYKLNISLTSLKLNLSERVIVNLLDFADNLPAPAPTTVPVCFRDAGDFAEELQDAELGELLKLDTVHVDPGYADLVRLRQKIVAAYLRRNSPRVPPAPPPSPPPPSEGSDSEPPQFARALDLPGFDDNVSPSNHIETLLRFVIGEIVINLSRSVEHKDRPYITVQVTKVCLDVALLKYGPALQLYIKQALVTDRSHPTSSGQYTELLTTEGELFNLLYRKVRCNCPEFRSHFHSVERSVVADVGGVRLTLHSGAIRDLRQYVQAIGDKIQSRREVDLSSLVPHSQSLWQRLTQGEPDPPVPSGATKFSYSVRLSSVSVSLESATRSLLRLRLAGMESDCVFRANDRLILKAALESLHADDLSAHTLYPKLIWPDEDKVLEMKYVRAAPRFYGNEQRLKADGELRVYVGRIHWVLLCSVIIQVQHFLEPLIPASLFASAAQAAERAVETQTVSLRGWSARLNLVIQIHAPVLLIPQKPSSPSLLVLNMGDLEIENFFKQSPVSQDGSSPVQSPVIDNILAKLANVTLSRAVMTLAGTLEVQEPILEPVSIRCDIQRPCSRGALLRARVECGALCACAGARDLAAVRAAGGVLAERAHLASFVPNSPTEAAAGDASVKDLQAFFAQGDSIRKEATISFSLEGIELKLFTDTDEVLSSPVRDASRGLAKLTAGEVTAQIDYFCDNSMEMKASLQSLLIEDIRPDPSVVIKRIFQSQSGGMKATAGISVSSPPLLELGVRRCQRAHCWDLRVDRSRVNLQMSLLMQLSRALLLQMPGDQTLEGGVVNLGYVGEGRAEGGEGRGRPPSSDCTSGYFSAASALSENTPGLSVSIQFRQPEIMLYTDIHKSEPHALLLRSELLIDYSHHANNETLVVSLAGLQVMSKLQSKLQNIPPLMVLMPCDVEYSKCFKNVEEGVKVKMTVSDVEVNIAPTTVHTVLDIIEEISTELTMVDEKEIFNFATYDPKAKKADEDLWSPKKLELYMPVNPDESYQPPKYTSVKPTESFELSVPSVKVVFEMEQAVRVPVLVIKLSVEQSLQDWSSQLQGRGRVAVSLASAYTCACDAWEPLLQPNVLTSVILQGKSYPMSSQLNTKPKEEETETDGAFSEVKRAKKRTGFESETSADEADTDNEMVFIKNPNRREHKSYNSGYNARNMQFISALDGDESDSENENGLMDKFATAIGHLFTDDSSDEQSNDEDSSAPQSEAEVSDREDDKAVTFTDGNVKSKREGEHKTVTLQDPIHQESVDSGLESDSEERVCSYLFLEVKEPLELTLTPGAVETLVSLLAAYRSRAGLPGAAAATAELSLVNDIGPGSTLQLRTRAETDLAGRPRVLVTADYDNDTSRPSTPGCDTSGADLLDVKESKPEMADLADEWEICESGRAFSPSTPLQPPPSQDVTDLYRRHTDRLLSIRLHDMDQLTVLCPQRSACKLHVLHPSKHNTRYYIVVERTSKYNSTTIVVRSPLQVRNETSYALELYYKTTDLQAVGEELVGSLTNPFDDKMRIAVLAPHDTYNVPLYIAYHCKLFLLPSNFESYQTATQGIWWMELASDVGTPRDIVCPAKADDDPRIFAMRILTDEGCQSTKVTRSIPNYVIRVLPPLAIYNRLPVAVELTRVAGVKGEETRGEGNPPWSIRIEAGDVYTAYTFELTKTHKIGVEVQYMGMPWKGTFTLSPELTEKPINMVSEMDSLPGSRPGLCARVERGARCHLFLFARYWLINKTGLPLQGKGRHSDTVTELGPSVALWRGPGALRLRAPQGAWSRAVWPLAAAPGLLALRRAALRCRLLLAVTLSELCPQLTKIITILPYFLVYNDTKRPLRFMEENEAADLWIDLAPQQCTAFWPQTDSMMMHCKYRDSGLVSQHFPITKNHFTVLRMDKGTAICVEVTGGTDRPFTVTFRSYCAGDAPVRVHNLCDDLFLKLHQMDSGQVALLSPYQSLLYTWDDPAKERVLMWNIYNNKGKGYVADFMQDGYGEEKVSFHSVKHSTLVATNSVTSKLSSTLKRLAPRSPPAESSSDSDSSQQPDTHARKVRKDKVTVYWISYMDGHQRVFALAQDERIAYQYRMRINSERSNFEVYASIAGLGLSVCVQRNQIVKELAYISMTDSLPRWEVNFNHKWKQLSPDLTAWIEDKYQQDQKKCQLKDYLHIDLEKMQMTKPFFAELRRDYSPGIWMQLRKSDTYTYFDLKVQRLQIDNQLMDAVFPCVLYPAPLITDSRASKVKPCLEIVALKQHRLSLNQDVYKYLKILVQEYNINLDRGFVNYVFDILNHWKIEEKPAVRLRADLALVHMPLSMIAVKGQTKAQKSNLFEFVHLSPLKLVLSLSSRGYSAENTDSPGRTRFRNKKEDRPKLFNSDLLEYIFNSWGSSLCDMKDVVLRMSYLEFRNAPITLTTLLSLSRRHYTVQLLQQFYVLALGLRVLGNPYSVMGDFTKGLRDYYEPHTGVAHADGLSIAQRVCAGAARLLGHSAARGPAMFDDVSALRLYRRKADICREATRAALTRQYGALSAEAALRSCFECNPRGLVARRRLPRHCPPNEGVGPYSAHAALGAALLAACAGRDARGGGGGGAARERYAAHAPLPPAGAATLLLSTENLYMVRSGAHAGWHVEWAVRLDDLIGVPAIQGDKLVLNIKQDELVNYYATDEKVIEISDPELLAWIHNKIECALIMALEDKRVPDE